MSVLRILACAAALCGCVPLPGHQDEQAVCEDDCDDALAGQQTHVLRANLLDNLRSLSRQDKALFGQQAFNISGIAPTPWKASVGNVARSDVGELVDRPPAVLGMDVWNLAIKPGDWNVRPSVYAEAARWVAERGGVVTMSWHMRGCEQSEEGDAFWAEGNEGCLCRLANDESYARAWLKDDKLARFVTALEAHGLTDTPIILRLFHEQTGDWFWWGRSSWSCPGQEHSGADAYKRVFRMTVDYLRSERGLDNLLVAYSPDSLAADAGLDELEAIYLESYPGDEYVDVLGIDLYYQAGESYSDQTREYSSYLRAVSRLARKRHKVAALTETGNLGLMQEAAEGRSDWFERHLLPLLRDSRIELAYVLTWDNRRIENKKFFVPTGDHPGVADFQSFCNASESLLLGQGPQLYQPADLEYPTCTVCTSDQDGDGWGWDLGQSCVVPSWCRERTYFPRCSSCDTDSDGDGWGWELEQSCRVPDSCQ